MRFSFLFSVLFILCISFKYYNILILSVISALEEKIRSVDNEKNVAMESYRIAYEKEKRTSSELNAVSAKVNKLDAAQNHYKALINDLKDKIESVEAVSVTVFVSCISI